MFTFSENKIDILFPSLKIKKNERKKVSKTQHNNKGEGRFHRQRHCLRLFLLLREKVKRAWEMYNININLFFCLHRFRFDIFKTDKNKHRGDPYITRDVFP